MSNVIVIGGGASGMMAAYSAAVSGHKVTVLERNEKCGKKIYITGKGRCNITNACDYEEFFEKVVSNPKFMYSAFYSLTNTGLMELFEGELGLPLKVERGKRVFPVSDKASDVSAALLKGLERYGVVIHCDTFVKELIINDGHVDGVVTDKGTYKGDNVILAAGGKSYPTTGSDGNGYDIAVKAGHTVKDTRPALVPIETVEGWPERIMGLSLKNVRTTFRADGRVIYDELGEMLFTHFGISGPLVITASSYIGSYMKKHKDCHITVTIDCKPALDIKQLDNRILRDFNEKPNVWFRNSLVKLLPAGLTEVVVRMSGIKPDKPVNSITAEERRKLVSLIKGLELNIKGLRGYNEAVITQGGISVNEVDPSTMESKLCKGLYITGEILDLDAVTGGYNLQIAWSTGYLAGISVR